MTTIEITALRATLHLAQLELANGNRNREALCPESSPDELDRIQHGSDRDCAIGNLERNSSRLREVQSAVRRIDNGSFGICVECGEDVGSKRLAAVPWAASCVPCQEALDRGQHLRIEIDTSVVLAA